MNYPVLNTDDFNKVSSSLTKLDFDMVLVHPDILRAFKFNRDYSRQQLLEAHLHTIKKLVNDKPVFMPAFNYEFPQTQYFDVVNSKSQIGVFPEYFRTHVAGWRAAVPMFSFCGETEGPATSTNECIDPFDEHSFYSFLIKNNGLVMHYGADIVYSTIIHYCERVSGNLPYRYDKYFGGIVRDKDGEERSVTVKCHVRPKNHTLIYNFKIVEEGLKNTNQLFCFYGDRFDVKFMKASHYADFLLSKMKEDSLGLLSDETKQWVNTKLDKLGRAFQLSDFE